MSSQCKGIEKKKCLLYTVSFLYILIVSYAQLILKYNFHFLTKKAELPCTRFSLKNLWLPLVSFTPNILHRINTITAVRFDFSKERRYLSVVCSKLNQIPRHNYETTRNKNNSRDYSFKCQHIFTPSCHFIITVRTRWIKLSTLRPC